MSLPASSEHAVAETAAVETPRTLRNSRRFTPLALSLLPSALRTSGRSSAMDGLLVSWLILVVAVRAVVARLLALGRRRRRGGRGDALAGRGLQRRVAGSLLAFLRDVAVHVTAHAPTHVEARVL